VPLFWCAYCVVRALGATRYRSRSWMVHANERLGARRALPEIVPGREVHGPCAQVTTRIMGFRGPAPPKGDCRER
jgi:hypothetical protein